MQNFKTPRKTSTHELLTAVLAVYCCFFQNTVDFSPVKCLFAFLFKINTRWPTVIRSVSEYPHLLSGLGILFPLFSRALASLLQFPRTAQMSVQLLHSHSERRHGNRELFYLHGTPNSFPLSSFASGYEKISEEDCLFILEVKFG